MRIPLGGGTTGRYERDAAKLRLKQALIGLNELGMQIANALDTAIHKATNARDSAQNYQTVVDYSRSLLQTELARLGVGKVESRKVLEVEANLLEANNSLADAKVQYQRALLELDLVQGSLLRSRNLELTQRELEARTSQLVKRGKLSDEEYQRFVKDVQDAYEQKRPAMDGLTAEAARKLLREQAPEPVPRAEPVRLLSNEEYEQALRLLRAKMHELESESQPK
jgi:polyhydroxyalkanoate synthesis regulator phasin